MTSTEQTSLMHFCNVPFFEGDDCIFSDLNFFTNIGQSCLIWLQCKGQSTQRPKHIKQQIMLITEGSIVTSSITLQKYTGYVIITRRKPLLFSILRSPMLRLIQRMASFVLWSVVQHEQTKSCCCTFLWTIDSILLLSLIHLISVIAKFRLSRYVGQLVSFLGSPNSWLLGFAKLACLANPDYY